MQLSVVVTACQDSVLLRTCLERVREQAAPLRAEVVLAVNAPESEIAPEAVRELSAAVDRLVFEPRIGKSHALNSAVAACQGESVAFTDDDAEPAEGWLEELTAPLLDGDDRIGGCGGPVQPRYDEGTPPAWFAALVDGAESTPVGPAASLGAQNCDYPVRETKWRTPLGANCAFRHKLLTETGYHPELGPNRATGLRGGEDTEMALRLQLKGYRILYRANAIVEHPVPRARMCEDRVEQVYYIGGIEKVRVARIVGLPLPTEHELEARIARGRRRLLWRRGDRGMRERFKIARCEGSLAELRSPGTAPNDRSS